MVEVALALLSVSLVPLIGGLLSIKKARRVKKRNKSVEEVHFSEIGELEPGTVKINGEARRTDDGSALRSPISRKGAIGYVTRVEEPGGGKSQSWETVYEDEEFVPFVVDDGTGEVRVEPPPEVSTAGGMFPKRQVDIELTQTTVWGDEEPPERVKDFIKRNEEVEEAEGVIFDEDRRYSEGVIEPGEEVYVFGEATEEGGDGVWGERICVIDETTPAGEFVVSDKEGERWLEKRDKGALLMYGVGGVAFVVGGLSALVAVLFFL